MSATITPPMTPDGYRKVVAGFQTFKLLSFLAALYLALTGRVTPLDLGLLVFMYAFTMLGITAGMHRYYAHRSYTPHPWLRTVLAVAGSMAGQGSVLIWVAIHRKHHSQSDLPGDPHSPVQGGLWHAHTGWILSYFPGDLDRYVPDLLEDRLLRSLHDNAFAWIWLGCLLPAAVGGLVGGSWLAAATGLLWGGWARLFLVEQFTCTVNSLAHRFGSRPFETRDHSTNLGSFALLTMGEAWHNNHHAFPGSARHGLRWYQLDPTWLVIRTCQLLGLAKDVVVPSAEAQAARRYSKQAPEAPAA